MRRIDIAILEIMRASKDKHGKIALSLYDLTWNPQIKSKWIPEGICESLERLTRKGHLSCQRVRQENDVVKYYQAES